VGEYVVNVGLNYTPTGEKPIGETGAIGKRAEPGDVVRDLDPHFVGECGPGCAAEGEHGWGLKGGYVSHSGELDVTKLGDAEPAVLDLATGKVSKKKGGE
jgi:hypothetical protein